MSDYLCSLYEKLTKINSVWYYRYKKFISEVAERRKQLQYRDLTLKDDEKFLEDLIFKFSNGIANRGQSNPGIKNIQKLLSTTKFIEIISKIILNQGSIKDDWLNLHEEWKNIVTKNNPVLVNRILAACNLGLSTTVDESKFTIVFDWFIKQEIINYERNDSNNYWYDKNIFLMQNVKKLIEAGKSAGKIKDGIPIDDFYLNMFIWELYIHIINPFQLKQQVIKYGCPGTGKTYQANEQAKSVFDEWKNNYIKDDDNSIFNLDIHRQLVQFHSSYSYEDFIEGLRPAMQGDKMALTLQNGVFKEFCKDAAKWEVDIYLAQIDKEFNKITIADIEDNKLKNINNFNKDYWQFILDYAETLDKKIKHDTIFIKDILPPFIFIIDEINRAEVSRVFGELMYCLEYRGVKGKIKTQYSKLNNEETAVLYDNKSQQSYFFIPYNVYVIGTMNTIDRSIESFDFAMRRRFAWENVEPNIEILQQSLPKKWQDLAKNLQKLNTNIIANDMLGTEYQIGQAYLMNLNYDENLTIDEVKQKIWQDILNPLISEYLRGSSEKSTDKFKQAFVNSK